jgi:hypothetical protein
MSKLNTGQNAGYTKSVNQKIQENFPNTIVEAIAWDKKNVRLDEVLDKIDTSVSDLWRDKLDAPVAAGSASQVLQLDANGKTSWVDAATGGTYDSALSGSSTNAVQNKVVTAKLTELGSEIIDYVFTDITTPVYYPIKNGETILLTNNGNQTAYFTVRDTIDGASLISPIALNPGATTKYEATQDSNYIKTGQAVELVVRNVISLATKIDDTQLLDVSNRFLDGGISTSGAVGSVVDFTIVQNNVTKCFYEKCRKGDVYRISGTGGAIYRLYCFVNDDDEIIVSASENAKTDSSYLYAPADGKIIVNVVTSQPFAVSSGSILKNNVWYIDDINRIVFENGGIQNADGEDVALSTRVRSWMFLRGELNVSLPAGFVFHGAYYYDSTKSFVSYSALSGSNYIANVTSGYVRLTVKKSDNSDIDAEELKQFASLEQMLKKIQQLSAADTAPYIDFDFSHEITDVSSIASDVTPRVDRGQLMSRIYSALDTLITQYPGLITKYNLATLTGIANPVYANYDTYMYRVGFGDRGGAIVNRKKLLLVCGVHGNEYMGQLDGYVLIKKLCTSTKPNFVKLLNECNLYVIPVLNGYGSINGLRVNGNGVNINRNMPTAGWSESGSGTDNYTGPSAGSETESKWLVSLKTSLKPDYFIDHHNYGQSDTGLFYTDGYKFQSLHQSMKLSQIDITATMMDAFPAYFGDSGSLFAQTGYERNVVGTLEGQTSRWFSEQRIPGLTIESIDGIYYNGGTYTSTAQEELFSDNTINIAFYIILNQLMRFTMLVANGISSLD